MTYPVVIANASSDSFITVVAAHVAYLTSVYRGGGAFIV